VPKIEDSTMKKQGDWPMIEEFPTLSI